jgi:hypothetical protein
MSESGDSSRCKAAGDTPEAAQDELAAAMNDIATNKSFRISSDFQQESGEAVT